MVENARNRSAQLWFSLVFAALLVNAMLTYVNLRALQQSIGKVNHTRDIQQKLESLLTTLVDAETGQRGFIITRDDAFLAPYTAALQRLDAELKSVREFIDDDAPQVERYEKLVKQIDERLVYIVEGIEIARRGDQDAPRAFLMAGVGRRVMDKIRETIAEMQAAEQQSKQLRENEAENAFWTALATSFITAALAIGLVGVAYLLLNRDLARREEMAAQLQRNMEMLEVRVKERTFELGDANAFLRAEVQERRLAEEAAQTIAHELQRSNRELEQFASVASHDLQEPLRKIQAFGDRLRDRCREELNTQGQDYLDRMLASAGRMRKLIDDLLAYSRVATKAQPFALVDLGELAHDVLSDLEARLQQTGGRIEIGKLPKIEADPLQIRQLFLNLFGNALKFQQEGVAPLVQVTARQLQLVPPRPGETEEKAFCEIAVQDNGIGFEQVYVDRIFELFQRLHGRDEFEGTGMGLAICRKIVDRHGGRITAESSPGKGAKFLVSLPMEQNSEGKKE